ncbi:uncharacterized protein STEHIDRAFT_108020 [Stereum hirsutum FP-91666 SS1]|uniref:uncharacterized protein n=1 Tax=Stereum hirsutum (strain FP-91666) TaxID=721885 RepID=UPI000440BD84|nr:uncharacterized protein STEHIDRAFT_108020 [Stereum hirsutum FP-91666 SS1]EIM91471.1 hypothetical protein STEHIDRAFT_108020 [Stereum hirsutum FP-91666 SS1]
MYSHTYPYNGDGFHPAVEDMSDHDVSTLDPDMNQHIIYDPSYSGTTEDMYQRGPVLYMPAQPDARENNFAQDTGVMVDQLTSQFASDADSHIYTHIFHKSTVIGDSDLSAQTSSSSSLSRSITFIAQDRYQQQKGKDRYRLPHTASSISFRGHGEGEDGVHAAVCINHPGLENAEECVLVGHESETITVHVLPSSDWSGTINIKAGKSEGGGYNPITRRQLFERLSRRFKGCVEGRRSSSRSTTGTVLNPFPPKMTLGDIVIRRLYQVSQGSWQVELGYKESDSL